MALHQEDLDPFYSELVQVSMIGSKNIEIKLPWETESTRKHSTDLHGTLFARSCPYGDMGHLPRK